MGLFDLLVLVIGGVGYGIGRERGLVWQASGILTLDLGGVCATILSSPLGPLFTDPRCFDASQQVSAAAPAGSLVFFSPHSVHGSEPNRSDRPRRAMVLTYQPAGHAMFKIDRIRNAASAEGP